MTTAPTAPTVEPAVPLPRGGPVGVDPADDEFTFDEPRRPRRTPSFGAQVVASFITILSVTLLGFSIYVGFGSRLHHDRAQLEAYADFRKDLALGTAPTGQTQPTHPNRLLKPGTAVAVLQIPELHLKEVVFEGTSGAVLENGPGHLRDSPMPGQAGTSEIMGRSTLYGGPFGHIDTLAPGDQFTVITGLGVQKFRVIDVRRAGDIVPPPVVGGSRLVLATADGNPFVPTGVLRVDAELTSQVQPSGPFVFGASSLPPSEKALGTDPSAWYPLVLFGQALVLVAGLLTYARVRWGGWQTWVVAVPVLVFVGLAVADEAIRLLPNLM